MALVSEVREREREREREGLGSVVLVVFLLLCESLPRSAVGWSGMYSISRPHWPIL